MKRKLLLFALSVLGSAFLFAVPVPRELLPYAGIGVFVMLIVYGVLQRKLRHRIVDRMFLMACGTAFAFLLVLIWNAAVLLPARAYDGVSANLVMTVSSPPYAEEDFTSFEAHITQIGSKDVSMRVRVAAAADVSVTLGDTITAFGELHAPQDSQELYDHAKGIFMRVRLRRIDETIPAKRLPLWLWPAFVSQEIGKQFDAHLSETSAGMLSALLLGNKTGLSSDVRTALRRAGLSHVAAVSGLHVSFLAGLLMLLFRRKLGMLLSVPTLLFFAVMTGASPSVLRAVIMQIVWIFSFTLERENDAPTAMGFAAVCILCMNPYAAGDIGLWLSFGSTFGITLWGEKLSSFFAERMKQHPKWLRRPVRYITSALGTTIASQVFVLPLSMAYFGETSIIAPLSNLLLLGAVQVLFSLGALFAAIGFLLPGFLPIITSVTEYGVAVFLFAVRFLADLPFSYAAADAFLWIAAVAVYMLTGMYLFARFRGMDQKIFLRVYVCMLAIIISTTAVCRCAVDSTGVYLMTTQMRGGQFIAMKASDVCVAVNCGGYAGVEGAVSLLSLSEVRDIDLMVLTDYNAASTNGLIELTEKVPVKKLIVPSPRNENESKTALLLCEMALATGTEVHMMEYGEQLTAEKITVGKLAVTCMAAGTADTDRGRLSVGLAAGETEVLVTGNVKPASLDEMSERFGFAGADVLCLSAYYASHSLPNHLLETPHTIITTAYDGVSTDVLITFEDMHTVYLPTYESITMRFGL